MLLRRLSLLAVVAMPLQSPEGWIPLTFAGKTPNVLTHSEAGLEIQVKASASPLFYKFKEPFLVDKVEGSGSIDAVPVSDKEDSALRVGLVSEGDLSLNWVQRLFAPDWLKQLLALAPGTGLGEVIFVILAGARELGDTIQVRKGITEVVGGIAREPGPFTLIRNFKMPFRLSAVWIQADGDDSSSAFTTRLDRLAFRTPD